MSTASAKQESKVGFILALGTLTVLALSGGGVVGKLIVGRLQESAAALATVASQNKATYGDDLDVRELPAIVTNLASPSQVRTRLQVSIVFTKKDVSNPTLLMAQVGEDLVAFMKTTTLAQLEGASGLHNLREDLIDRAMTRSQGKVREVIIEALVVQ